MTQSRSRNPVLNSKERPKTRRHRGKFDPTRLNGALVISDEARLALERCLLFQGLERNELMAVAALVEETAVEVNEMLLTEGDTARYLYIVIEGQGAAQVKTERGWLSLGLVGPGEAAGWSSLMGGSVVYPASVKALTDMKVARIETSGLKLLMNVDPKIGYPVLKSVSAIFYLQYEAALTAAKTA
ncbi:MAG: cyclic nucleotide-binding domain-containing protein [Chloroflexi bacterium]|nr:cyclic nucleotide-binding domain-containing protein [Chloroflexota bacterium]MCH9038552.1 cyclic nucleotide-binding domain-containing protein [Chloroflexota bacterium]MCI0795606.1 cyclic nucleotide-binding domain-containing protein [Chloroflexota bacterium]MCI0812543.1 cyclic nucleotide-binding domain-containing protein [Chloroflexota bacterium]MCI0822381.1 cyclic nucleotide-binding domain-containing protein [Chloroflexota bacterium]